MPHFGHEWDGDVIGELRRQNAELRDEVKRLRAALEKSDDVVLHMTWCRECGDGPACSEMRDAVEEIRARAPAGAKP